MYHVFSLQAEPNDPSFTTPQGRRSKGQRRKHFQPLASSAKTKRTSKSKEGESDGSGGGSSRTQGQTSRIVTMVKHVPPPGGTMDTVTEQQHATECVLNVP